MRLRLVNPKFPESFWTYKWAIDEIVVRTRTTQWRSTRRSFTWC
jgi:hypothetical protein